MSTLTSLEAVKRQLEIDGTLTSDDDLLSTYVTEASALVEGECNRQLVSTIGTLNLDCGPPHVYGDMLYFDKKDVRSIVSLTNGDGDEITADKYLLIPANDDPKYALRLKNNSGVSFTYVSEPKQALTLVATLGLFDQDSVPSDMHLAATKLAAWLYQNRDNDGSIIQLADGAKSIPAEAPAVVLRILQSGKYIKHRLFG